MTIRVAVVGAAGRMGSTVCQAVQDAEGLELPGTEKAARECLSLPVHPSLSEADLERIGQAVAATVKAGA